MTKDAQYWIDVQRRISGMRQIDARCELVFGSSMHRYMNYEPVSEERLARFESINCVTLPPEYRSFLTAFGAGGAGPDYGIYDFAKIESVSVRDRFHLTDTSEWPEDDDDPMWDLPGLLPISTSGCAIDWSIEINGPQPGTMWVDAGPGDRLMRCETFGTWYEQWLDRVELGLQRFKRVSELIGSNATLRQIAYDCGIEPTEFNWDGIAYVRFPGIPGRIRASGDRVQSFDVGTCWIF